MIINDERHRQLYRQIPSFECIPGCNDCCGVVQFSDKEWKAVPEKKDHAPGCLTCPYSTPDGCGIYEHRPLICRLFGTVDHPQMTCPHGRSPKKKLTAKQGHKLVRKYQKLNPEPRNWDEQTLRDAIDGA